jgi:hypothetical protein
VGQPITRFEDEYTAGFGWTDQYLTVPERLSRAGGAELARLKEHGGRRESCRPPAYLMNAQCL